MVDAPYGVLTDWSKLEQLRGRSVVEGVPEGVAGVTVGVADTMLSDSLQPLGGDDIAQSNTPGRLDVEVGSPFIQQRDEGNNTDELMEAMSLTGRVGSVRKLVMFTDGGLDHGGTEIATGQYAAVIAPLEGRKLTVLAKQGGCVRVQGNGCRRTGVS